MMAHPEPNACHCCLKGCHEWPGCTATAEESGLDLGIVGNPPIRLCAECADHWTAIGRFEYRGMLDELAASGEGGLRAETA